MQSAVERRSTVRRQKDRQGALDYVRELESQNNRLKSLINVSRELMQEVHLDRLLELIMEKVTEVMNAERSSLFLLDHKTDELYARVAQGLNAGEIRFPNGKGIAGHAGKTGRGPAQALQPRQPVHRTLRTDGDEAARFAGKIGIDHDGEHADHHDCAGQHTGHARLARADGTVERGRQHIEFHRQADEK